MTKYSAIVAAIAALTLTVLSLLDVVLFTFKIPSEVYWAVIFFSISAFIAFVISKLEALSVSINRIISGLAAPLVEVFTTRDAWLRKLIELETDSSLIGTLHYSEPPLGSRSQEYFEKSNSLIQKRQRSIIYRRITTVPTADKAKWIFSTIIELADCENFSTSIVDMDHRSTPQVCLHVGIRNNQYYQFIFDTVQLSGKVSAFLLTDHTAGTLAYDTFERIWAKSIKLKEGDLIHKDAITELAKKFNLTNSKEFQSIVNILEEKQPHSHEGTESK